MQRVHLHVSNELRCLYGLRLSATVTTAAAVAAAAASLNSNVPFVVLRGSLLQLRLRRLYLLRGLTSGSRNASSATVAAAANLNAFVSVLVLRRALPQCGLPGLCILRRLTARVTTIITTITADADCNRRRLLIKRGWLWLWLCGFVLGLHVHSECHPGATALRVPIRVGGWSCRSHSSRTHV